MQRIAGRRQTSGMLGEACLEAVKCVSDRIIGSVFINVCFDYVVRSHSLRLLHAGFGFIQPGRQRRDARRSGALAAAVRPVHPATLPLSGVLFLGVVRPCHARRAPFLVHSAGVDGRWRHSCGRMAKLDGIRATSGDRVWLRRAGAVRTPGKLAGRTVAIAVHGDRILYPAGLAFSRTVAGQLVGAIFPRVATGRYRAVLLAGKAASRALMISC